MCNYNKVMKELAEYKRIAEQTNDIINALQDELKQYMAENGLEILTGDEHKATYKTVKTARMDTRKFKTDMPELAAEYIKEIETKRFCFA